MTPRTIVLTGGPGAGKTTLLDALAGRGHAVAPEAAIQVIGEVIEETGSVDACRVWRRENQEAFQLRIAQTQSALEAEARASGAPLVFCDRGLIDGLAYLERRGKVAPPELLTLVAGARYDAVFLLSTLTHFEDRSSTGRTSSRADSLEIADALRSAYAVRGYRVVDVPEASVEERADLVLAAL